MRMKYNIRYCCRKGCKCHPETTISELLKDDELANFLKVYSCEIYSDKKNVLETIKKITKESDESITIYDDKNLKKVKNNTK